MMMILEIKGLQAAQVCCQMAAKRAKPTISRCQKHAQPSQPTDRIMPVQEQLAPSCASTAM